MTPLYLRRILHWAGSGLGIVGVVFVVVKLTEYGDEIAFSKFSSSALIATIGLTFVCGAANALLALAWQDLLRHLGIGTNTGWVFRTYGVTLLAKYVPGNIFHLAGRQAIGQAAGLAVWPLAKSAVWEISLISATGSLFAILVLTFFWDQMSTLMALAVFLAATGISMLIAYRWLGPWIARGLGWYVVFLTSSGIVFALVVSLVTPAGVITGSSIVGVCGAYVVAWLAGFVTPGAPAGAGVRELLLYSALNSIVTEHDLLVAIVLGRLVTVGGDIIFFVLSGLIPRQEPYVAADRA